MNTNRYRTRVNMTDYVTHESRTVALYDRLSYSRQSHCGTVHVTPVSFESFRMCVPKIQKPQYAHKVFLRITETFRKSREDQRRPICNNLALLDSL